LEANHVRAGTHDLVGEGVSTGNKRCLLPVLPDELRSCLKIWQQLRRRIHICTEVKIATHDRELIAGRSGGMERRRHCTEHDDATPTKEATDSANDVRMRIFHYVHHTTVRSA
jgi:hypothetical protein